MSGYFAAHAPLTCSAGDVGLSDLLLPLDLETVADSVHSFIASASAV